MNTFLLYNVINIRAELSISVEFCLAIGYSYFFYLFCDFFNVFFFKQAVLESSLLFKITILSSMLKFCDITIVEYELHTQVL